MQWYEAAIIFCMSVSRVVHTWDFAAVLALLTITEIPVLDKLSIIDKYVVNLVMCLLVYENVTKRSLMFSSEAVGFVLGNEKLFYKTCVSDKIIVCFDYTTRLRHTVKITMSRLLWNI